MQSLTHILLCGNWFIPSAKAVQLENTQFLTTVK